MEISFISNVVKLMAVRENYSVAVAAYNLDCWEYDSFMAIRYEYHEEAFPEIEYKTSGKVCFGGYPLGSCCGCGKCEW